MNDLISREKAIKRATADHDFYRGATLPTDKARRDELLNVMCWLNELPSAEPHWIPVSERLPEEKTDVLVCNDDGKMGVAFIEMVEWRPNYISPEWRIKYCLYDSDSWDQDENGEITAWMELPEPYRGEE